MLTQIFAYLLLIFGNSLVEHGIISEFEQYKYLSTWSSYLEYQWFISERIKLKIEAPSEDYITLLPKQQYAWHVINTCNKLSDRFKLLHFKHTKDIELEQLKDIKYVWTLIYRLQDTTVYSNKFKRMEGLMELKSSVGDKIFWQGNFPNIPLSMFKEF